MHIVAAALAALATLPTAAQSQTSTDTCGPDGYAYERYPDRYYIDKYDRRMTYYFDGYGRRIDCRPSNSVIINAPTTVYNTEIYPETTIVVKDRGYGYYPRPRNWELDGPYWRSYVYGIRQRDPIRLPGFVRDRDRDNDHEGRGGRRGWNGRGHASDGDDGFSGRGGRRHVSDRRDISESVRRVQRHGSNQTTEIRRRNIRDHPSGGRSRHRGPRRGRRD